MKKLYRRMDNRIFSGVCSGIADYFSIDPTLVRVAWVIFSLFYGAGVLFYILCIFIIPRDDKYLGPHDQDGSDFY